MKLNKIDSRSFQTACIATALNILFVITSGLCLTLIGFSASAQENLPNVSGASKAGLPDSWGLPNSGSPMCVKEGFQCRFNGDCCQGVCKNFQVCDAGPLFCVPAHFQCNTNQDCCDGECSQITHECNAR